MANSSYKLLFLKLILNDCEKIHFFHYSFLSFANISFFLFFFFLSFFLLLTLLCSQFLSFFFSFFLSTNFLLFFFSFIYRTLLEWVDLPLCRDAIGVFYCPNRLGSIIIGLERLIGIIWFRINCWHLIGILDAVKSHRLGKLWQNNLLLVFSDPVNGAKTMLIVSPADR